MLLCSKISQVSKIVCQRVAVLALQRVVINNIFQIVDDAIQLALVEMSLAQMPIEIRRAALCVSISLDLFFVSLDFLDVSMAPEIRSPFEMILHTGDQITGSGIWNILGRSQASRQQQNEQTFHSY